METTHTNLWEQTLASLELELDPAVISTWFKNTHLYETTEDRLIVACSDTYSKNIIHTRYAETIMSTLKRLKGTSVTIEFIVKPTKAEPKPVTGPLFDEAPQSAIQSYTSNSIQYIPNTNLNDTYTLDNYVVGVSNRVVHAAATSIIDTPGTIYNPLFIYGTTGVGKTHLLHAIGNSLHNKNPHFRIIYATTERFVNDLIDHIRQKKEMRNFRDLYRTADVLLIDDIQFLSGKESSQEEFYHTFNELYQSGRQIVIASDREPSQIDRLADRLVSRFKGGLITMITPPDYETRLAIVTRKAREDGLPLSMPICEYIAEQSNENIRELHGLMLQLKSHAVTRNEPINLALVRSLFNPTDKESVPRKRITAEHVLELVTDQFGTTMKELCGKRRKREVVVPRQLAMFLLRNELGMNLEAIGHILGGRDHTTVMHGCDRIKSSIENDNNTHLRSQLLTIRQQLYS